MNKPKVSRSIIEELYFSEKLSTKEIAKRLNCGESTVKTILKKEFQFEYFTEKERRREENRVKRQAYKKKQYAEWYKRNSQSDALDEWLNLSHIQAVMELSKRGKVSDRDVLRYCNSHYELSKAKTSMIFKDMDIKPYDLPKRIKLQI